MIKDFLIAVGNYKKYGQLLKNDGFKVTGYVAVLMLVCSIGLVIAPVLNLGGKTLSVIWDDIPKFTLTDEFLDIDGEFNLELGGVKMAASDEREFKEEDFGENISGFLFDKDSVIIRNFDMTQSFAYNEFGKDFFVTKDDLYELKPFLYLFVLILYVMMYVAYSFSYALNGLFLGAVASVIAMFMGIRMRMGKHISLAMYAQTLPYILASVLLPFGIGVPQLVMYAVPVAIMVLFFRTLRGEAVSAASQNEENTPEL